MTVLHCGIRKRAPQKHLEAIDAREILCPVNVGVCTFLEYLISRRIEPCYSLQAIDIDQLGVLHQLPCLHFSLDSHIKTGMFKLRCQWGFSLCSRKHANSAPKMFAFQWQ